MIKIKGKIQDGFGAAKKTIKIQRPHLKKYLPEIDSCADGTINVLLEQPLIIFSPDIVTAPIHWIPNDNQTSEKFGFVKIKLQIIGQNNLSNAWIYIAYRSPHYANPFYIEIIAPLLDIQNSKMCNVIIENHKTKELSAIVVE